MYNFVLIIYTIRCKINLKNNKNNGTMRTNVKSLLNQMESQKYLGSVRKMDAHGVYHITNKQAKIYAKMKVSEALNKEVESNTIKNQGVKRMDIKKLINN